MRVRRLAVSAAVLGLSLLAAQDARADCVVAGTPVIAKAVPLFGSATGTIVLGSFTGQPVPARLTLGGGSRAALKTGGGFRVEGFVEMASVPAYTQRNVAIAEGHVWIGTGRTVKVTGGTDASVQIEFAAPMPVDQTVRATTSCDALGLDPPTGRTATPPDGARSWVAKRAPLLLRNKPGGESVFRFTSDAVKGALLFWGTEVRGGSVKVALASDLVVDAWADVKDLEAMPRGEMLDAVATAGVAVTRPPKVTLGGSVKIVKAPADLPIRAKGDDASPPIGMVDAGTEVAILETIVGWSNVVPTTFAVMPPATGGFWVKADGLVPPVRRPPASPLE